MAKIHLKHSTLQAGTGTPITVRIESGDLTDRTPNVNISDTGSGGTRELLDGGGLSEWDMNFEGFLDVDALPHTLTASLASGSIVPIMLTLKKNAAHTGKAYSGNLCLEESSFPLGSVRGTEAVRWRVRGLGSGPLTRPAAGP